MLKQQIQAITVALAMTFTPLASTFAADGAASSMPTSLLTPSENTQHTVAESQSTEAPAYNEMVDANKQLRPHYQSFHEHHSLLPVSPEVAAALNDRPLRDSIRILPIPLILTAEDQRVLDKGIQQIGHALQMFFADIFINPNPEIYSSGVISEAQIRAILESSREFGVVNPLKFEILRSIWHGMSPEDVRFVSGPDVIRGQSSSQSKPTYTALEVNVNNIGGGGDVDMAHAVYRSALLNPGTAVANPQTTFIRIAAEKFVAPYHIDLASPTVMIEKSVKDDDEDNSAVMTKDGEDSRIENSLELRDSRKPKIRSDKANRYGRLVEIYGIDINAETYRLRAKKDKTIGTVANPIQLINFNDPLISYGSYGNLEIALKMFKKRTLRFFTAPGTEFLSNKALMPFIDDIVRFYLNEEPAVEMQDTEWVKSAELVGKSTRNTVIKPANGSQGSGVEIEKLLKTGERAKLVAKIKRNEEAGRMLTDGETFIPTYVRQEFVNQSYLPSTTDPNSGTNIYSYVYNVDIRGLTYVDGSKTYLHPRLWGRASPKLPGSLTNVSQSGSELIVLTPEQSAELECAAILRRQN